MPFLDISNPLLITTITLLVAVLLDIYLGEPRRWHPLVGFGFIANCVEYFLNRFKSSRWLSQFLGFVAWLLLVIVVTALILVVVHYIKELTGLGFIIDAFLVYFAIGFNSLRQHAKAVVEPLQKNDLVSARKAVAMIVSRDADEMKAVDVRKATIESVLENGSDAIYAPIFWFIVGGVPAVIIYRFANTLDAMWGYKTKRFLYFGRFAARMDDILNWLPARLVGVSYGLLGNTHKAIHCWLHQSDKLESPNGSVVMTMGAGALELQLGGDAMYHGELKQKPDFGCGNEPVEGDIERSIQLVERTLFSWCALITLFGFVIYLSRLSA